VVPASTIDSHRQLHGNMRGPGVNFGVDAWAM